ncbi:hypothetical protein [Caballeronia sp. AZ10_KS36]|uniref:LPD3 domain-containing protein n=1 Tax=Caballeronia sp. AZ10_KS36 TaxID=2921757 RepID=UPI002028D38B|nr:hypothetical protein [Caballeronia sp. AZ10_KS36]
MADLTVPKTTGTVDNPFMPDAAPSTDAPLAPRAAPAPATPAAPVAAPAVDTGAAVDGYLKNTAQGAQTNLAIAFGANPDYEAEISRLSKQTGVPIDSARKFPDQVKQQAAIGGIDFQRMATQFPSTAAFYQKQQNANVAHDDVDALQNVERSTTALGPPGNTVPLAPGTTGYFQPDNSPLPFRTRIVDWARNLFGMGPGEGNAQGAGGAQAFIQQYAKDNGVPVGDMRNAVGGMSEVPTQFAQGFYNSFLAGLAPDANGEAQTTAGGIASGVGNLAGFVAGAPLKVAGAVAERLPGVAHVAGESFAKGLTRDVGAQATTLGIASAITATGQALDQSTPSAALATLGMAGLHGAEMGAVFGGAGRVLPDNTIVQTLARAVGVNTLMDAIQGTNPLDNRPTAQKIFDYGLNTIFAMHGAGRATGGWLRDAARAETAAADGANLQNLADAAAQSKLRARDPDTFREFVAQANENGPVQNVYVDGNALTNALAQSGIKMADIERTMPDVAKQIPEALAMGGDVTIPVADFAAHIAGSKAQEALMPHLKTDPDGMTFQEASEFHQSAVDQFTRAAQQTLADRGNDDAVAQSSQAVHDDVLRQLGEANRFTPDVNKVYAALVRDTYTAAAARAGTTPEAMYQRYPLRIAADDVTGANSLNQAATETPEFKNWFGDSKAVDSEGRPLVLYHGTGADFTEFKPSETYENGIYFTPDPRYAAGRARINAQMRDGAANVMPSFVKIERPAPEGMSAAEAVAQGYDGLIRGEGRSLEYVVFNPEQVKSAIGNRGTFDPRDPNILHQDSRPAVSTLHGEEIAPKGTDIKALRAAAADFYTRNLAGTKVHNGEIGDIELNKRGMKKALWSSANPDKLRLFAALPDILQNGRLMGSADNLDLARKPDVVRYHYLEAPVELDGKRVTVRATVEERNNGKLYYNHTLPGNEYFQEGKSDAQTRGVTRPAEPLPGERHEAPAGQPVPDHSPESPDSNLAQSRDNINLRIVDQGERGKLSFADDITSAPSTITLTKNADLSTFVHELGHFQLEMLAHLSGDGTLPEVAKDFGHVMDWFGLKPDEWRTMSLEEKREYHEKFARGFESYLFEGKAPSAELRSVFQKVRAWMVSVYQSLKALNVQLSPEVRGVFDRMLATNDAIRSAEAERAYMPMFATPEEAGMTPEQFADYHKLAQEATLDASDELTARTLRDMRFAENTKIKALRAIRQDVAAKRAVEKRAATIEVMKQPVYQAWQFLTLKGDEAGRAQPEPKAKSNPDIVDPSRDNLFEAIAKHGGLNRDEIARKWGVDPKDVRDSGVFGKPVARKEGGLSIDAMAERLVQDNYLDAHDLAEFEEKFDAQRRGEDIFSWQKQYEMLDDARPQMLDLLNTYHGKLDTNDLRNMYGEGKDAPWHVLSDRRMTSEKNGIDSDILAETFGFSSGRELVEALMKAEPPIDVIRGMTDQRMLEKYGDITDTAAMNRAANEAIHNEVRARFIATELKALAKATGPVRELERAAREVAENTIAGKKVREISAAKYAAAEARAGRLADAALRKGDIAEAAAQKRNQLLNNQLERAARAAATEVTKGVAYLRKFDTPSKTLDPDYRSQIESLLDRFDLRASTTGKDIARRESLVKWVEARTEEGLMPVIPESLLNEAYRKSYKDMTVDEMRGLLDSVRNIEHLGRLKQKLLTLADKREFNAFVEEAVGTIEENAKKTLPDKIESNQIGDKIKAKANRFLADHRTLASLLQQMDGKDGGFLWDKIVRPMNERGDWEARRRSEATKALREIFDPIVKKGDLRAKLFIPEINDSLSKEGRLAVALNWGNETNQRRILTGDKWSPEQVQAILRTLSKDDWQFVQKVWDHIDTYWPEIAEKQYRVTGVRPEKVEAQAFINPHGDTMRGGYYPIKYDPTRSTRAEEHEETATLKQMLGGAVTRATTRRGFTEARVEDVNRPVRKDLGVVTQHVEEVLHDLAWHEWLIDTNRVLGSGRFGDAVRAHYGPEVLATMKETAKAIAIGDVASKHAMDAALAFLRKGTIVSRLGFNVISALKQFGGFGPTAALIGAGYMRRGLIEYMGSAFQRESVTRSVYEKSDFMRLRGQTLNRDIREVRNQIDAGSHPIIETISSALPAAQRTVPVIEAVKDSYLWMIEYAQRHVDVPAWIGAYRKGIDDFAGDEAKAVAYADQVVRDSQGSGLIADQPQIMRGGQFAKLFTTFYSALNAQYNLLAKAQGQGGVARLASAFTMAIILPSLYTAAVANLRGHQGGNDDWQMQMAGDYFQELLGNTIGMMVGVRELSGVLQGFDYTGPTPLTPIADFGQFSKHAVQMWERREVTEGGLRAANKLAGDILHYPAGLLDRVAEGYLAWQNGDASAAALVVGKPAR